MYTCVYACVYVCFCPSPPLCQNTSVTTDNYTSLSISGFTYMIKIKSVCVTSHALYHFPRCHKLLHLLGPLPSLERDVLYGQPQKSYSIKPLFLYFPHLTQIATI